MPQFLDLPNEILLQIIAPTNVEDMGSFSSCSKRIHSLFGDVLKLHKARKIKYSKTVLGLRQTQIKSPHAVLLLRDVLENPDIAHYPTKLVIGDCVNTLDDWPDWSPTRHQEEMSEINDAIAQCRDLLSAKVDACPYIGTIDDSCSRAFYTQRWMEELCEGNERTAVAFLVTLFPNLKSITISDARFYPRRVLEVVSNIAAAQQDLPQGFHPLRKLNKACLKRSSQDSQADFDFLDVFADLKSVRLLAGNMVHAWGNEWDNGDEDDSYDEDANESEDANDDGLEKRDHNEDCDNTEDSDHTEDRYNKKLIKLGGGTTSLRCRDSAIDAWSFNLVLKRTEALRDFEYSFNLDSSSDGAPKWQPAAILRGLLLNAGHSLVSLKLTGMKGSWDVCGVQNERSTKSPRHFQVLKQLHVQDGIFVEGKGVPHPPQSTIKPWWSIKKVFWKTRKMVDILPASLEKLTLFPSFDDGDQITSAFEKFPEMKEHRLPRLNDITLEGGLQLDESVKLACKKAGTSVVEL